MAGVAVLGRLGPLLGTPVKFEGRARQPVPQGKVANMIRWRARRLPSGMLAVKPSASTDLLQLTGYACLEIHCSFIKCHNRAFSAGSTTKISNLYRL